MSKFGIYLDAEGVEHKALVISENEEHKEGNLLVFIGKESDFESGNHELTVKRILGVKHVWAKDHIAHSYYRIEDTNPEPVIDPNPSAADLDAVAAEAKAKEATE